MKKFLFALILIFITAGCSIVDKGADINAPINYAKYDLNDINAVRKATKEYQKKFKDKKGTKEAEDEFLRFWEFYCDFSNRQNEIIKIKEPEKLYNDSYQLQVLKFTEKYENKGLKVSFTGYEYYIENNNEYIYKNFSPFLGDDWNELLKYLAEFDKKLIYWDSVYTISREELIEMKKFYEDFYKKYPNFVDKKNIKSIIKSYEKDLKTFPYPNYED